MTVFRSLLSLLLLPSLAFARPSASLSPRLAEALLPMLPLSTSGRWIVDTSGTRAKLRCINWAAHMETNIPEGLNWQSADWIASFIASQGFNCVRLTYSIDMALNDPLIATSFPAAAQSAGLPIAVFTKMYTNVVTKNPSLADPQATAIDAFDLVIRALGQQGVMVVLDNHVSHATWCCSLTDGNGWFNTSGKASLDRDTFNFDVDKWLEGLSTMASYATDYENVIGLSLRNEFRPTGGDIGAITSKWNEMAQKAGQAIHTANPDALIMMGGINYATSLRWLSSKPIDLSQFDNKAVMEFHIYPQGYQDDCPAMQHYINDSAGYLMTEDKPYTAPLWISEFGWPQQGNVSQGNGSATNHLYLDWLGCLKDYLESNDADWAMWALPGSYYIKSGKANWADGWGLVDKTWSRLRDPGFAARLGQMWDVTQGPGMTC